MLKIPYICYKIFFSNFLKGFCCWLVSGKAGRPALGLGQPTWPEIICFYFFSVAGRPTLKPGRPLNDCSALGISESTDPVDRSELQSSRVSWVDRPGRPFVEFSPKSVYLYHCFSLSLSLSHRRTHSSLPQNFFLKLSSLNPSKIPSKPSLDFIPWCWIFVFRASSPQNSKNFRVSKDLGFVFHPSGKNHIFPTILDI